MVARIQLPGCGNANYYLLKLGKHKNFQCKCCRLQTSLIAGTLFQGTHLALNIWFLAIYLISQAKTRQDKTGLSALDLKRQLDVSYPTAWLIQQKLMQAMIERDALCGNVQTNDSYHHGELAGGKAGRGSENGVTDAGCQHRAIVADSRKPKELPEFNCINTVLGNLKISLGGVSS